MPFASLKEAYEQIVPDAVASGILEQPYVVNNMNGERVNEKVEEFDPLISTKVGPIKNIDDYYYAKPFTDAHPKVVPADEYDANTYYEINSPNKDTFDQYPDTELNTHLADKIKLKCRSYMNHFKNCKECKIKAYNELVDDPDIKEAFTTKFGKGKSVDTNSMGDILLFLAVGILLIYVLDTFVKIGAHMKRK